MPSPLATLIAMLEYKRPYRSKTLDAFIDDYIAPLPGAEEDPFGNWHVDMRAVTGPHVLWSSHTDTVHSHDGKQKIRFYDGTIDLPKKHSSSCLGADDTVGVFLMREMILAGVPGYYIFHAGEEKGCIGSSDLAEHCEALLKQFDCAIALDRKGTNEVITHQMCSRGASDAFAWSLAKQLTSDYEPSPDGVYTDTAQYMGIIPECVNLSVGYYSQHSSREWIDASHVLTLRAALLNFDHTALIIERDPTEHDSDYGGYGHYGWYGQDSGWANGTVRYNASQALSGPTRVKASPSDGIIVGTRQTLAHGIEPLLFCPECCEHYTPSEPCICRVIREEYDGMPCTVCGFLTLHGRCECNESDLPPYDSTQPSIYLSDEHEAVQRALRDDYMNRYPNTKPTSSGD